MLAMGPAPQYGTVRTVNIALTLTEEVPGTFARDSFGKIVMPQSRKPIPDYENEWTTESGSGDNVIITHNYEDMLKLKSSKYSTKELLIDLVRYGVLPGQPTNSAEELAAIKGWSIVQARVNMENETELGVSELQPVFFAQKKGEEPINLSDYLAIHVNDQFSTINLKTQFKQKKSDFSIIAENRSYAASFKAVCDFGINLAAPGKDTRRVTASGIYAQATKLALSKDKRPVLVPAAAKISSMAGYGFKGETDHFVEGSVSFGAGTITPDIVSVFGNSLTAGGNSSGPAH